MPRSTDYSLRKDVTLWIGYGMPTRMCGQVGKTFITQNGELTFESITAERSSRSVAFPSLFTPLSFDTRRIARRTDKNACANDGVCDVTVEVTCGDKLYEAPQPWHGAHMETTIQISSLFFNEMDSLHPSVLLKCALYSNDRRYLVNPTLVISLAGYEEGRPRKLCQNQV